MSALTSVAQGVPTTILLTLLGFVLGALGGIPLALGRGSHIPALRWSARFLIEVLRGIPTLAWLFIIYFGVGSGLIPMDAFTAAVLGFGVVSAATWQRSTGAACRRSTPVNGRRATPSG